MHRLLTGAVLVIFLQLTGCTTIGTLQRANTLGEGGMQVAVEPYVMGATSPTDDSDSEQIGLASLSLRYGATDRLDVGARIGLMTFEFLGKYQLTAPGSTGVVLSVAPTFGGVWLGDVSFATGSLPLLVGIPVGDSQLVLGPKIHVLSVLNGRGGSFSIGGSAGFAWSVSDTFQVMPELAVLAPVAAAAGNEVVLFNEGAVIYQFGLGLLFGAR